MNDSFMSRRTGNRRRKKAQTALHEAVLETIKRSDTVTKFGQIYDDDDKENNPPPSAQTIFTKSKTKKEPVQVLAPDSDDDLKNNNKPLTVKGSSGSESPGSLTFISETDVEDLEEELERVTLDIDRYGYSQFQREHNTLTEVSPCKYGAVTEEAHFDIRFDADFDHDLQVGNLDNSRQTESEEDSDPEREGSSGSSDDSDVEGEEHPQEQPQDHNNNNNDEVNNNDGEDEDEDEDGNERQQRLQKELAVAMLGVRAETHTEHASMERIYKMIRDNRDIIAGLEKWPCYKTMRRSAEKHALMPISTWVIEDLRHPDNDLIHEVGTVFKEAIYGDKSKFSIKKTWSRISIREALTFSDAVHEHRNRISTEHYNWKEKGKGPPLPIHISVDGVALDKTSAQTLDVVSIRVPSQCKRILPIGMYVGEKSVSSAEEVLEPYLHELNELNIACEVFLADAPMRSKMLNMKGVTGRDSCQKCLYHGDDNRTNVGGHIVWGHRSVRGQERTHDGFIRHAARARPEYGKDVCGVYGPTILTQILTDVVWQVPADWFHTVYLGVTKRLLHLILKIRKDGKTPAAERQNLYKDVNSALQELSLPSEMKRGLRSVQQAKYKASEWKNVALVAFPVVVRVLVNYGHRAEAKLWLKYIFYIRVLLMGTGDYDAIRQGMDFDELRVDLYKSYERIYGIGNCTSNVHQLFAHMHQQRDKMTISQMSTEDFETFYSLVRKGFKPGTPHVTKQIMSNIYMYYETQKDYHACEDRFNVKPKGRGRQDDSYLYTEHGFLHVMSTDNDNNTLVVRRVMTSPYKPDLVPGLDFSYVNVGVVEGEPEDEYIISIDVIFDKAIVVEGLIMAVPRTALFC